MKSDFSCMHLGSMELITEILTSGSVLERLEARRSAFGCSLLPIELRADLRAIIGSVLTQPTCPPVGQSPSRYHFIIAVFPVPTIFSSLHCY